MEQRHEPGEPPLHEDLQDGIGAAALARLPGLSRGGAHLLDEVVDHLLEEGAAVPAAGTAVHCELDWDRRYRHMRMHTAMHLLGAVLRYGVTGGNISAEKSRLDFDMEDTVDKEAVGEALTRLVAVEPQRGQAIASPTPPNNPRPRAALAAGGAIPYSRNLRRPSSLIRASTTCRCGSASHFSSWVSRSSSAPCHFICGCRTFTRAPAHL